MYGGIQTVRISIILYFIDPLAYPVWKRKIETVIIIWEKNYKCLVFMHNLRYNSDINSTFFLKCILNVIQQLIFIWAVFYSYYKI